MKIWIRRIFSVIIVLALLLCAQRLVCPKYASDLSEGSYTSEYYQETLPHQVLMVGDCELYENFDPVTLWNQYGITSYIRGNAQQLTWQSYYLLKEALETETPDVVVFNVLELKYDEPQKEEYNRLTLDSMKWSANKVAAISASMTADESFLDYLFPILRYHSRITQLTAEDITCFVSSPQHTVSGYYMRADTSAYVVGEWGDENYVGSYTDAYLAQLSSEAEDPADDEEENDEDDAVGSWADWDDDDWDDEDDWDGEDDDAGSWADWDDEDESDDTWAPANTQEDVELLGENAMHYLDLIRELCEENGVTLLLVKAPSVSPVWYDKWDAQITEYAETYQLDYLNYLPLVDEIGIDFATDTYDEGLHMNYYGAVKCADYLGQYLVQHYDLQDNRSDATIAAVWEQKAAQQQSILEEQMAE
jgi:hypothetical protein